MLFVGGPRGVPLDPPYVWNRCGDACMADYIRRRKPGGSYFFTVNLLNRKLSLLTDHVDHLRAAFACVKQRKPFHIDAIVVLPEHLHVIMTLPIGDADYSLRWNQIKQQFSRWLPKTEDVSNSRSKHRERGIWQRRFWEHTIRDDEDYIAHVDYIHYNPVKHGYVARPIDWPHSSLHQYVEDGVLPATWGTNEIPRDWDGG
jgi:putative transposase